MIPEQPGLRERKKSATRQRIRDAALQLTLDHGLEEVTVEMITDVAGVSRRTFFNYFHTKEDALVNDMTALVANVDDMLAGRPDGEPPLTSVRVMFAENDPIGLIGADPSTTRDLREVLRRHQCLLARQLIVDSRTIQALGEVFARRAGRAEPSMDDVVSASLAAATFRTAVRVWVAEDHPRRELADFVSEAFTAAFAAFAEPAEKEIDD